MTRMSVLRSAAAIVLLPWILSCSRPVSTENFMRADQAQDSTYVFAVDLFDTLQTWDILFYTVVDHNVGILPRREDSVSRGIPLQIQWVNPASDTLSELVYMPYVNGSMEEVPYRTGLCPQVPGVHMLSVRVCGAPEGFRGLGVICRTIKPGH